MRKYLLILMIISIGINSYSQGLVELSGQIIFNETNEKIADININFLSLDVSLDTTITTDKNGFYRIHLPKNQYNVMISNDSLIGGLYINAIEKSCNDIFGYYNYMHDYKIFKTGFSKIYTSKNSITIGLKENGEFRRTTFVGIYAAYSFIENGIFKINNDTIVTKTKSVDSYYTDMMDLKLIDRDEIYIIKKDSSEYLIDSSGIKYDLIKFDELKSIYVDY